MGCAGGKSVKQTAKIQQLQQLSENQTLPQNLDIKPINTTLQKFQYLVDDLGDTSRLPNMTQRQIVNLIVIKEAYEDKFEQLQANGTEQQISINTYNFFIKHYDRTTDIIISLLNDEQFNKAYPILRESFKNIYHQMQKDYSTIFQAFFPNSNAFQRNFVANDPKKKSSSMTNINQQQQSIAPTDLHATPQKKSSSKSRNHQDSQFKLQE